MSYQVLARKWRPKNFTELVGQSHVVRALSNALDNDRLHHAYLFTGTRGVGKTTLARILAKSLNCESGVSSTPCGVCSVCQEIDEGRFADLLEVDAASRTKVDQTRELLDNVPYAPVRGRYKVYLIDEVHMFSDSSFNALLKTLEEPPPHVKFLLATTDPQKVPVTVLSRCLQFSLKRLSHEQIMQQFKTILAAEEVSYDDTSLHILAVAADGSMRDGLSLLDQAIAYAGGVLKEKDVRAMLGIVATEQIPRLLELIDQTDAPGVIDLVTELGELAPDYVALAKDFIRLLHRVALLQQVPQAGDESWGTLEQIQSLAAQISQEDIQLYYQMALMGQRDIILAPDPRSGFEMLMLRMLAFKPGQGAASERPAKPTKSVRPSPEKKQIPPSTQTEKVESQPQPAVQAEPTTEKIDATKCSWEALLGRLQLGGMAKQLASHCSVKEWQENQLILQLDPAGCGLMGGRTKDRLEQAIADYCEKQIKLVIEECDATLDTPAHREEQRKHQHQLTIEHEMRNDPVVKMLEEQFDATLQADSIKPLNEKTRGQ